MKLNTADHLDQLAQALARCVDCGRVVRFDQPGIRGDYRCPTCRWRRPPNGTAKVVPSPRPAK